MKNVNKQINDQAVNDTTQTIEAKLLTGELNAEEWKEKAKEVFDEKNSAAMRRVIEKEKMAIHKALTSLEFEAVLNKNQI